MEYLIDFMASNSSTLFWIAATVALIIVEISTVQMICIWFAVGSLVTVFASMLGASQTVQFVTFAVVSALALMSTRKFVKGVLNVKKTATNADSVIGLSGSVIEEIDNKEQTGRIRLGGLDWAARTVDGSIVHIGEMVVAEAIEGVKLMVSQKK